MTHGGGGERILSDVANFLVARGHTVEVHSLPLRRQSVPSGLDAKVMYCEKWAHKFQADVAYYIYTPLTDRLFYSRSPKIAGLHGAVVGDYSSTGSLDFMKQGPLVAGAFVIRRVLGDALLREFDAVHTVDPSGLPISHRKVFVIPNWVSCSRAQPQLKRKRPEKFRVLFVGKPSYNKGFDIFTEASRLFDQEDIEFVATFEHSNSGRVKCLGYVPQGQLWKLYATSGVLLHPTRNETFGLAILESLASGTPVITTPIRCHTSLGLPVHYASDLMAIVQKLKQQYILWKEDYQSYLAQTEEYQDAILRYDQSVMLLKFEAMLYETANHISRT